MDLDWTKEQAEFRAELIDFITQHRAPGWTHYERDMSTPEELQAVLDFCGAMAQQGLLTPHWPQEYGGRNASLWEQTIISEEIWAAGEPRGAQYMNTNWIGPAIMTEGTADQRELHLPPIARGEAMWCQGFSEPGAGSDLAALQTSAVLDGDSYVVNGQKVWTSYANVADYCFLLVRTGRGASPREGITVLLVPMSTPGVEVRDIPNAFTDHLYHEIYFTDVRVPTSCRLGEEGDGWSLVRRVLANERVGIARAECTERTLDAALRDALSGGVDLEAGAVAETMGLAYATSEAARSLNYAAVDERIHDERGRRPLASMSRVMTALAEMTAADAAMRAMGDSALLRESPAERQLLAGTTTPLTAGSLEVQLNAVARLALDLPKG